ncbi:MAG: NAD(P)/FAD-dependent oxidoreductase [Desulfobulbaceae bacterium]|nr:NAD(P)/FAD-dependent oxidoreductase [Desulfobulbaceae bacterium]
MTENRPEDKTYNVLPGPKMGLITPAYLEEIAADARKHGVPFLKITGAQRLAIAGHSPATAAQIWQELGQPEGPKKPVGIHYIQACPGKAWCKYGRQDSLALGKKFEESLLALPLPAKTKVGISGCQVNCCESYLRDLGVFGTTKGWSLVFGGNGGGSPRIGDVVGEGLNVAEVLGLAHRCLDYYRERARKLERTGRLMRRTQLSELQEYLALPV